MRARIVSLSVCFALTCAFCGSVAAVDFLVDDFESYFDDVDLELAGWQIVDENDPPEGRVNCDLVGAIASTWTVLNFAGRANPPGEDGFPSTGQFLISDSDASCGGQTPNIPGTGQSHDIWTPEFSTEGSTTVWLHADVSAQLNNNGTCIFDIDVSLDDGATWTNAFRRVAPSRPVDPRPTRQNTDGYFGRLHVDLSGVAADSAAVRVRLRHFEPNWDWWIAVDNLIIDDVPPPLGGEVIMLGPEDFNTGIPSNWTLRSEVDPPNSGDKTWTTNDPGGRFNGDTFPWQDGRGVHRLDPPFAIIDSDVDPDPPEDEWLITPILDLTEADDVFLHYREEIDATGATQEVLVSLDGGETFTDVPPVFSYNLGALFDPGEEPFYHERVFQIEEAAGESEVVFAFHYAGPGNEWWWAIDDVMVTANGPDPCNCANLNTRTLGFDAENRSVTVAWRPLPAGRCGDLSYRVFLGDTALSDVLGSDIDSFTQENVPGIAGATYSVRVIREGETILTCEALPLDTFVAPSGLSCCANQQTRVVDLTWTPGVNVPGGQTLRLLRDGVEVGTPPLDASSFTDTVPGPGIYQYELSVPGAPGFATLTCGAFVTATPVEGSDVPCGGIVNQYDFNDDLSSSSGGRDLLPAFAAPAFEPEFDFETATIGGEEAQVLRYGRGTYFQLFTGLPANGGGQFTNRYTLVMDVMFPGDAAVWGESGWAGLYQTNTNNANDGEWYLNGSNSGIGISGNYGGTIEPDTWHRVALVVDLVDGTYSSYIDGSPAQQNTGLGVDGRFSLYTVNDGDLEGILIFADENSENSGGLVNSVQIRDEALSAGFIAALGGPSAEGIPVSAPFACPTDLLCCTDRATGNVSISWNPGEGVAGTGWRITRNGIPLRTVPLDVGNFVDESLPSAGTYNYEIRLNGGDPEQCANLPLSCTVEFDPGIVGDDVLFFDDFDCYADDSDLQAAGWQIVEVGNPVETAAWTVTNPGGRANPPTADGRPSEGRFVISDSDAASGVDGQGSGRSHDLWSPAFSAVGVGTVWLHMDVSAVLNNNGTVVFDVDVSPDDGATWVNVFRRVAPARTGVEPRVLADIPDGFEGGPQVGNADGFYGRLDVDISAQAAGRAKARVRLRQFEPDDDWWIAVDNVRVDSTPVVGGRNVLLPVEDFSDGIPDDWTTVPPPPDGEVATWTTADCTPVSLLNFNGGMFPDGADGRRLHHFDDAFAISGFDELCGPGFSEETLITPPIDCSEALNVYLHVKASLFATASPAAILLSLDGGETFAEEPIFSYQLGGLLLRSAGNAEVIYNEYIFEVPDAAGETEVAFGFLYQPGNGWWAIDDVMVTADGPGGGTEFRRGDTTQDGVLNITDAVKVFGILFLGEPDISCQEVKDVNNDGAINITDGIRILGFLFLGQPAPEAPGHENCGLDPDEPGSPGDLGCDSHPPCE